MFRHSGHPAQTTHRRPGIEFCNFRVREQVAREKYDDMRPGTGFYRFRVRETALSSL